MNARIRFASLAAGAGLGSYGAELSGAQCVSTVEIDDARRKCLAFHYPTARHLADLRTVCGRDLCDPNLLFVSTPCPSFSVGNRMAEGLNDDRGALLFEAIRLVDEVRPEVVLIENVPAMLYSTRVKDVETCLNLIEGLGYHLIFRETLSSQNWLAQSRKRLFLVYVRKDRPVNRVAFRVPSSVVNLSSVPQNWLGDVVKPETLSNLRNRINRHGKPGFEHLADSFIGVGKVPDSWRSKPIFHCNHSNSSFGIGHMVTLTKTGRAIVRWDGQVHKLSVTAHEELMGLPAGFTACIGSDAQRRHACGDGIVVPVAQAVFDWIGKVLSA